ncbi:hypothetical protein SLE2022_155880 [Rubroshorea leprosula]
MVEMLRNTVIPEPPMFKSEFPPHEAEHGIVIVDEDGKLENWLKQPLSLPTPSKVAEHIISVIDEFNHHKHPTPLLVSFDAEEIRKQAASSTRRLEEGNPLSILDGIFMEIKDDTDCYPHPSTGATTWMH